MIDIMEKIRKKERKNSYNKARVAQVYSLAAIPLLFVFVFSYLPMFGLVIAFKNYRYDLGIWGSEWVGFKNFKFFFESKDCARVLRNTLGLNSLFIVATVMAAVVLALFLYELNSKNKTKIFQTILITPHFLSWVVVAYMVYALLNPSFGMINKFLMTIGMQPVDWYSTPNAWPAILTIASIWKSMGMDSVMYYAALMGMDSSIEEAARIDGASQNQIRWKIFIPSIVPIIMINVILKIGNVFRSDFGLFYQLTRDVGTLYPTTDVIDTYIFRALRELGNIGMSSAVGAFQSVVGLILVLITNYVTKKINPDNALL